MYEVFPNLQRNFDFLLNFFLCPIVLPLLVRFCSYDYTGNKCHFTRSATA